MSKQKQNALLQRERAGENVVTDAEKLIQDIRANPPDDIYMAGNIIAYWAIYIFRKTGIAPRIGL